MMVDLDLQCRRRGHGNLILMEVSGLYYTFCPDCIKKTVYHKDPYEFCGLTKNKSIEQYMESEGYRIKKGKECYKQDWKKNTSTKKSTNLLGKTPRTMVR